jgi:hypothetical protein
MTPAGLARARREVVRFAAMHPHVEALAEEIARLIRDYGATLPGAYRVAYARKYGP